MKWFKHYSNASRGGAIQILLTRYDKARAYGLYFLMIEYFANKWDGCSAPIFKVHASELGAFLGLRRFKLDEFLGILDSEMKLKLIRNDFETDLKPFQIDFKTNLKSISNEDLLTIEIPKMWEILHKDAIPSQSRPARIRPESGREEKRREENILKKENEICELPRQEIQEWFALAKEKYKTLFPTTTPGPKAKQRFCEQIKTAEEFEKLNTSLANYFEYLKSNTWRHPKQSFETFLGTKKSGYFWRDFIDFTDEQKIEQGVWLK